MAFNPYETWSDEQVMIAERAAHEKSHATGGGVGTMDRPFRFAKEWLELCEELKRRGLTK